MRPMLVAFCLVLSIPTYAGQASPGLNVVAVYEGVAKYLNALEQSPTANREALWKSNVVTPYWKPCAEGGEYIAYAPSFSLPPSDIKSLRATVAALRASAVEATVRAAIEKSAALLPTTSTTVCLFAADPGLPGILDMHGVNGFTAGAGKIWLTLLPAGDWKEWITYGVAHEYHHSVWTRRYSQREPIENMADYLVFEGRADSFARLIEPQRTAPWTSALTSSQEAAAWRIIQRHLDSTSEQLLLGLMFGGAEGTPRWSGYTVGFAIVQSYLSAHPTLSVERWTELDAAEIVRNSPYASAQ
jgi:uncharacterized protein YjaZ